MEKSEFEKVLESLAEPFSTMDVEWKPGALSADKSRALALAYVDSRAYITRLNAIAAGDWQDEYQVIAMAERVVVICKLTIFGVTRTGDGECPLGDGEDNAVTTASAQAFKRACVKFGLGLYLYDLPQKWCDYDAKQKRIIEPPRLPEWAVPFGERDAYKAAQSGNGNGNGHTATASAPAPSPAKPAPTPAPAASAPTAPAKPAPTPATTTSAPAATATATPAPAPATTASGSALRNTVIHFGRYQGKTLAEVAALGKAGMGWLDWCARTYEPKSDKDAELKKAVKAFLVINSNSASAVDGEDNIPF